MNWTQRAKTAAVLPVFTVIFITLTVASYTRESATWDEPQHVLAGYAALKHGDYRVDPEHPPLLRLWAAAPLMLRNNIRLPTEFLPTRIDDQWTLANQFAFVHATMYRLNDADSILYPARFMIVLLGIGLGILLFFWARELFGFGVAVAVLVLYLCEPNLSAHARLVTTDFGVTALMFGAVYFLWRCARALTPANLVGLAAFFALAQASKFTALLLGPICVILLAARICRREPWTCRLGSSRQLSRRQAAGAVGGIVLLLAVASVAMIWVAYDFRYLPARGPVEPMDATASDLARIRPDEVSPLLCAIDRNHLLPNLYTQGLQISRLKAQQRGAFLAGNYSNAGWWYYFPVAFAIKTPVAILLLSLAGAALYLRQWKTLPQTGLFLLLPVVVVMGAAMQSHLNIGLRHILPVYPFALLLAGKALAELLPRARRAAVIGLLGLAALEVAPAYPHYLAFFNSFVGGPRNGHKYLVDSNLDWGQDLKGLKRWMDKTGLQHINLSYFGTADPGYYGIGCTHLPGAPFFAMPEIARPQLPGYVAISVTNLRGVYLNEAGRAFYRPLLEMKPVAVIGHSIRVYWVTRQWW